MPHIVITDNVTGESKILQLDLEEKQDAIQSSDEAERKPRKASKKAEISEQTES